MNKLKLFFIFSMLCLPAFAADTTGTGVSERMDCATMQAKISELAAIASPDDDTKKELSDLQERYRRECSKSASGRKTSGRVSTLAAAPTIAAPVVAETKTADDILSEFLQKKDENCESLKKSIDTLSMSEDDKKKLQNQYDTDCLGKEAVTEKVEVSPEQAAANVAAGLCTDGSKPNKFGCCAGETFKDMGNLVFACCPDDGGECYPPITTGN